MNLLRVSKWIFYLLGGVLVTSLLILIGFAVIPPKAFSPEPREPIDESSFELEALAGWYLEDNGVLRMMTWGGLGGLTFNRFDTLSQRVLLPKAADQLVWQSKSGDVDIDVLRDSTGSVTELSWIADQGKIRAKKLTHPPYHQKELYYTRDSISLSALCLLPSTPEPVPAVVFIHGSGNSYRDFFWYLYQADYLAKNGIAVLLPDKRGCGKSGGQWHEASMEELAKDALSGVNEIRQLKSLELTRIGLLGMSQGGMIAPMAASLSNEIDFVINVSGSATTFNEQVYHEVSNDIKNGGVPSFVAPPVAYIFTERAKKRLRKWWNKNGSFDPIVYWKKIDIPALIIYGDEDENDNVPVKTSVVRLEEAKRANPSSMMTIQVYQGSGHAIDDPENGWIRNDYLEFLSDWIKRGPEDN